MRPNQKVIWAEGLLLSQQHFQCWDNHQQRQRFLFQRYALCHGWGIAELIIDESYLPQGIIHLNRCVALLEDGRWIEWDSVFDKPLTLNLPEQTHQTLSVYLTCSKTDAVSGITGYPEAAQEAAWVAQYQSVCDAYDDERENELLLAKPNLQLQLGEELQDGYAAIKIAELEWNAQQFTYQLSPNYLPPSITLGASSAWSSWLARLKSKLVQNIAFLNNQKMKHCHVTNQFGYGDFIYFNLIKTLTSHLPAINGFQQSMMHPYELYHFCLSFVGELWGYVDEPLSEPALPAYNHKALSQTFEELFNRIDELLKNVLPANALDVRLERISDTRFQTQTLSVNDLKSKQFCLALQQENMPSDFIKKILTQVKVASPNQLTSLIQSFMPGIELSHLTTPGKEVLAKQHYHYFALNKHSPGWEEVVAEKKISIFVSHELVSYPFELISYD